MGDISGAAAPGWRVPQLVLPRRDVAASVRSAARAHGDDHHPSYSRDIADLADGALGEYVETLLADAHEESPRPAGYVPSTHLWWVEQRPAGAVYLGRVHVRHRLTPHLREVGGHVGYYVVPTERRRGHATAMLAAALPVAARLGLERVLLTCDVENTASRRVIESAGGLLEDLRGGKRRYWVPTD